MLHDTSEHKIKNLIKLGSNNELKKHAKKIKPCIWHLIIIQNHSRSNVNVQQSNDGNKKKLKSVHINH